MSDLEKAANDCLVFLGAKPGVYDLGTDINMGKEEFRFKVKDDAQAMGITATQLADAVRGAYYGEEVMRLFRSACDEQGQTILLVTHNSRDAAFSDEVHFLRDGELHEQQRLVGDQVSHDSIAASLQTLGI